VNILKEDEGLDASKFFAQRLDRFTILSSDLIFCMEDSQVKYVLELEPKAEGRVFNLKKFFSEKAEKDMKAMGLGDLPPGMMGLFGDKE